MDTSLGNDQVLETLEDLLTLDAKIPGILKAWRAGDEAGIEAFTLRELKNHPELYNTLIVGRNQKWVGRIETLIAGNQNVMIIMGVAHLAGADSVVTLLKNRGHKVTKLKIQP